MKPKAAGYIRVSTVGQADEDKMSLELQAEHIAKYCRDEGFELILPIFEDAGVSGAKAKRPGLDALKDAAYKREFQHLVVNDLTRFGRSANDLLNNLEYLRSHGIMFHSYKDKIDVRTPSGKMLFTILSACAEFELETIKARMSDVRLAKLRGKKIYLGNIAFGYKWNEETCQIEVDGKDPYGRYTGNAALFLRLVSDCMDKHTSLSDIALKLKNDKIPSPQGKTWFPSTIRNMFHREFYKGFTTVKIREKRKDANGKEYFEVVDEVPFDFEPLLTPTRWDDLQLHLRMGRINRSGRPVAGADNFVLRDLLRCGICNGKIVPKFNVQEAPRKRHDLYYACWWRQCNKKRLTTYGREACKLPILSAPSVDEFVYSYVVTRIIHHEDPELESPLTELVETSKFEEKIKEAEEHLVTLKEQLARNERGLKATRKSKEARGFSDFENYNKEVSEYLQQIAEIKHRILEVTAEISRTKQVKADREKFEEIAKSDMVNDIADRLWELNNEDRHRLLTGLLDGPVMVTPPADYDPKTARNVKPDLFKWLKIHIRPNIAILQDVLGLPDPDDGGDGSGGASNNNSSLYGRPKPFYLTGKMPAMQRRAHSGPWI